VWGGGIFVSGVSEICVPDAGLFAEIPTVRRNNASNSRARLKGGGQVGLTQRDTAASSDNSLSLDDPLSGLCAGTGKLRRLPTGGEADACSIHSTACVAAVAEDDPAGRKPLQWGQARVEGEPKIR